MSIWKVIFATLVIFGAGVITGVLGYNRFYPPALVSAPGGDAAVQQSPINPWPHVAKAPQGTNSPAKVKNDFIARFGKQLELTGAKHPD